MADKKISQLIAVSTPLAGTEVARREAEMAARPVVEVVDVEEPVTM